MLYFCIVLLNFIFIVQLDFQGNCLLFSLDFVSDDHQHDAKGLLVVASAVWLRGCSGWLLGAFLLTQGKTDKSLMIF